MKKTTQEFLTTFATQVLRGSIATHAQCGEVAPILFCFSEDASKKSTGLVFQDGGEAKYFMQNVSKSVAKLNTNKDLASEFYAISVEAWVLVFKDQEQPMVQLTAPSQSPDRRSALLLSIFDAQGKPIAMAKHIMNDDNKTFGELEINFVGEGDVFQTGEDLYPANGQSVH